MPIRAARVSCAARIACSAATRLLLTTGLFAGLALASSCASPGPSDDLIICIDFLKTPGDVDPTPVLPARFVDLRSQEGQRRLRQCDACADQPALAASFLSQLTQAFCGLASGAMVLNADDATRAQRPVTMPYEPYPFYTQCNLLNAEVRREIDVEATLHQGLTLAQIRYVLSQQAVAAKVRCLHAAGQSSPHGATGESGEGVCRIQQEQAGFVADTVQALDAPSRYVIANFSREGVLGEGSDHGHFSPLAAHHAGTNSFLVMDVARYKYPPFWISAEDLWNGMRAVDSASGRPRGYLVVETTAARD